jgi:hypothetical protein
VNGAREIEVHTVEGQTAGKAGEVFFTWVQVPATNVLLTDSPKNFLKLRRICLGFRGKMKGRHLVKCCFIKQGDFQYI